jgi:hypothetical protein
VLWIYCGILDLEIILFWNLSVRDSAWGSFFFDDEDVRPFLEEDICNALVELVELFRKKVWGFTKPSFIFAADAEVLLLSAPGSRDDDLSFILEALNPDTAPFCDGLKLFYDIDFCNFVEDFVLEKLLTFAVYGLTNA